MSSFLSQKHKNIGIVGLGKTGMAAYQSLNKVARIICYDQLSSSRDAFSKIYGNDNLVGLSDPRWQVLDRILLSPGVPLSHDIVTMANSRNIPITSDIDLLFEEVKFGGKNKTNFIGITGTNGKSTTTALTGHILQSCGFDYPVGGNIGFPALSMGLDCQGYVLELSSFQLDLLSSFKAKIAVLLNITEDHLERHNNIQGYIAAKKKIFNRMDKDSFAIISVDNEITNNIFLEVEKENKTNVLPISVGKILDKGVSIYNNVVYDNIFEPITVNLRNNSYLQGIHNQENIAASYAACRIIGVTPEQIIAAIELFKGLPHRMQYVGTIYSDHSSKINFYNDSKATNGIAASKSIAALDNIYWLAGGVAKEGGITNLEPWFNKIRKAYLFGQDKELFALSLKGKVDFQICQDLQEAFNAAVNDAMQDKGELKNILLAPACASYDQFKNFEERGNLFIELYNIIANHDQR
ncbi:UDP-N-acetylmuramoyl-L-alanine--D-glutamate ligase [Candidatus Tisiphia endosymbiont of Hybos culiciformis]|uniref:UDP-N-acetylmuramoyl-L-alanine--D-glutamate ligase n=1 Tax=Candidatus Tisiphia endosymbiont of Hybos culiciformis TaxID=3139331 RepID=UPI003CCB404F